MQGRLISQSVVRFLYNNTVPPSSIKLVSRFSLNFCSFLTMWFNRDLFTFANFGLKRSFSLFFAINEYVSHRIIDVTIYFITIHSFKNVTSLPYITITLMFYIRTGEGELEASRDPLALIKSTISQKFNFSASVLGLSNDREVIRWASAPALSRIRIIGTSLLNTAA